MLTVPGVYLTPCLFIILGLVAYYRLKAQQFYWHRFNIPQIPPLPLLGNLKDLILLRTSFGDFFRYLHHHPSLGDAPIGGIYVLHTPALIIRDPELIHSVLVKNFDKFLNRYEAADPYHDPMGSLTLPLAKYHVWRDSRKRMAELFTSGRLRNRMYPLMIKLASDLESYLQRQFPNGVETPSAVVEVKEMCALYTTDVTAQLLYSIQANGLRCGCGDPELRRQVRNLFRPSVMKALQFFAVFFLPLYTSKLRAKVFSGEYSNFMRNLVATIVAERDSRSEWRNENGDLIDLLMKFKRDAALRGDQQRQHFTQHDDFIASQVAIFLLAGFETSSSVIAFALYELSKQPQLQQRLRAEINGNFEGEHIPYDNIVHGMKQLHKVVAEALRMYPAAAFVNRECTPAPWEQGFRLQLPQGDVVIPRGMPAYISILGLHYDPKHWPDPERFDPERFSEENIWARHPMTYIPFGAGPHGCIGSRLGLLQVKLGLAHILRNFRVETCAQTPAGIRFEPSSFMLQADQGIYLRFLRCEIER